MRHIVVLILFFSASGFAFTSGKKTPPQPALDAIKAGEIAQHVSYLASDELHGRNTPSPGLEKAAAYIADHFQANGLEPVNDSYFQEFKVSWIRLGPRNSLEITSGGRRKSFKIKREFMPFDMTGSKAVQGELVFVGYGITAPEFDYDDYAGIDVSGKIVLVLRHEPGEKDDNSPFDGRKMTPYGQVKKKVETAIAHGASGVLVVTDPANHRSIRPRGFPWPSLFKSIPDEAIPLSLSSAEKEKIPVVHVGKRVITHIFGHLDTLRAWQETIDQTFRPASRALPDVAVTLETSTNTKEVAVKNVVGLVRGSDPKLAKEVVVIGAHYDHVGAKRHAEEEEDFIFNGADDNASGTSVLCAMASAFGKSYIPPRRSILLIAFAGEEKGLFGSRAYVEAPLFPLKNTVAMLNFDMVGRNAPDSVFVGGRRRSPELVRINEEENRYIGMKLDYSIDAFYSRSDQYNFARHGIPFLFYFTGLHEDYHKVSDHAYKVNANKIAMIARLGFRVAWRIANTDQHFKYSP